MGKLRPKYVQHAWARDADGRPIRVVESVGGPVPAGAPGPLHPVLTVVIPAHGRQDLVANAVASVRRALQWNCAEVVVVDDASPEPVTVDGARVVRLDENVGFGRACDRGADGAAGAFLLFLNSDAALRPGCIEAMLEWAHRGWDIVGARLEYPDGRLQHGGFDWDGALRSHVPHKGPPGEGRRSREVDAVSGACLLVRAEAFRALGGFGGAFGRGYYEDVDLCLRAWESGRRVMYAADAAAVHWESQSFGDVHRSPEARAQIATSHRTFLERWPSDRLADVWSRRTESSGWPTVDVVVTAHGASDRVAECLRAVRRSTEPVDVSGEEAPGPFRWTLTVVDDASPPGEAEAVAAVAEAAGARLLRLPENVGYRRAAEAGIAATSGDWFVLLNSDTVPCAGWLAKLVRAGQSDPRVAVVNPASNGAANLSAPIPRGRDLEGAARAASAASLGSPVDVAYPVGFCLMVRRRAWEDLGGFDSETFPEAYGEETDLCERAFQAGWRCALDPSAYVYHESHGTYGVGAVDRERRAVQAFLAKHGAVARARLDAFEKSRAMPTMRATLARARPHDPRPSLTFFLPELNICGGVLACYHLARRLQARHGWRVAVATRMLLDHEMMQHAGRLTPLNYASVEQFAGAFPSDPDAAREGVLVATAWFSAKPVADAVARCGGRVRGAYFVQDDESTFLLTDGKGRGYDRGTPEAVYATYRMLPHLVANSAWVRDVVRQRGADAEMIPVGVDHELFRPRPKYDRFTVLAMCRHTTPRRGYELLSEVYRRVRGAAPDARLLVYGQVPLPRDQGYMEHVGQLPQHRLADVMGRCHVLVEPSATQGFGLPALEAMASGCVPVTLDNRGIHTYGLDGRDCLVAQPAAVADTVLALRADPGLLGRLAAGGRETALRFTWDIAAERWDRWLRGSVLR